MPRQGVSALKDLTWYLSGPMAGYAGHNFAAFEETASALREQGWHIVSPHEVDPPRADAGEVDVLGCLREDFLLMVAECEGIMLMPGWPQSRGARAELAIACELGWPVLHVDRGVIIARMDDPGRGAS